jgi:xylitol oxidase
MNDVQKNWAGNIEYSASRLHFPETVEQVQDVVRGCDSLKVLGSRHSFNHIADSKGDLVSLDRLESVVELDRQRNTVTVNGNIKYGELCQHLHDEGYALHNLASLPHISVAGACATATHGSGDGNGNLATAVSAIEIVTADGEVVKLSREQNSEVFPGAVVGLGGLGVITKITLDVVPTFELRQNVFQNLPLSSLENHFDAIMGSAYSVSLFTDWRNERFDQVWLKQRLTRDGVNVPQPELFGASPATRDLHPIEGLPADNCTRQMGVPGPWHERLPHFRMEFTPSSGEELQTEYFVARKHAIGALRAISQLGKRLAPWLLVSEARTVAADDLWMSPCYRQDSVALHFTWKRDWQAVRELLPRIEEKLAPFDARPHWGKLFTMSQEQLHASIAKMPDFRQLLMRHDPGGKFRNAFLDTYIFGRRVNGTH